MTNSNLQHSAPYPDNSAPYPDNSASYPVNSPPYPDNPSPVRLGQSSSGVAAVSRNYESDDVFQDNCVSSSKNDSALSINQEINEELLQAVIENPDESENDSTKSDSL